MPMKRIVLLLSLTAQSLVSVFAGSKTATNPPSECKAEDASCSCEKQDEVGADCIKVNLDMGTTTPWTGSRRCSLKVFADSQSPLVFTPESLYAVCGYTLKRIGNRLLADRTMPREVVFSHPNGEPVHFVFADGKKGYADVKSDAESLFREGANEFIRRCASKTLEELQ